MSEQPEHNNQTMLKLAYQVVEDWDLETLVNYAIDQLQMSYEKDKDGFYDDWKDTFTN